MQFPDPDGAFFTPINSIDLLIQTMIISFLSQTENDYDGKNNKKSLVRITFFNWLELNDAARISDVL